MIALKSILIVFSYNEVIITLKNLGLLYDGSSSVNDDGIPFKIVLIIS